MKQRTNDLVHVHAHRNPAYAVIDLAAIEDPDLSWAAKGLYYHLATRPTGHETTDDDLPALASDGPSAIRSALKELEARHYISVTPE